jgi:hypothetical protein
MAEVRCEAPSTQSGEIMIHSNHVHDQADSSVSEVEAERQAYLEETHIESSQFGAGRIYENDE